MPRRLYTGLLASALYQRVHRPDRALASLHLANSGGPGSFRTVRIQVCSAVFGLQANLQRERVQRDRPAEDQRSRCQHPHHIQGIILLRQSESLSGMLVNCVQNQIQGFIATVGVGMSMTNYGATAGEVTYNVDVSTLTSSAFNTII